MAEASHASGPASHSQSQPQSQPPPAPPLPPSRTVLQRIIAPLSFNIGTRPPGSHSTQSSSASPRHITTGRIYKQLPSQTTAHRTGIPISALDLNKEKTHAILAGQEILKTVRIHDGKIIEDFNLRSAINSYASAYGARSDAASQRREYLPAKDVRWSHGDRYNTIVATAALNGRIALYDVTRLNSSRVELAKIHQHTGQVNKLDFDPFSGYLLLSGSQDKTVKIWDIRDSKTVLKKQNFNIRHPVRDLKWSPTDAGEFALCTESGIVQRWDLRMPNQVLLTINAHEKACYTIDWHPDGRHLVSGGLDKYVRVWDFKSENRRQKPAFQLRTPQAVMNLAWRPPHWSSESTQTGDWQCTQLATGYTDDDPRVHVWDLRRPLLPFRELDRYNSRPTDLLWASKDILWTVGNEGMFTQTDMRHAAHVHDEVAPCTMDFMPDGSFFTFAEYTEIRSEPLFQDPEAGFLRIPQQRLSGATDGGTSQSVSDDDGDDDLLAAAYRRHSKAASSRSAKSQGNTPPNTDGLPTLISLDLSVPKQRDLFNNEQMGTVSSVQGVAADPYVVEFLAENYSRPLTIDERKKNPANILQRLQQAFMHNADACDYASLHRMGQSWRVLCAVIVPELQDWVNKNRQERLDHEASLKIPQAALKTTTLSPRGKVPARDTDSRLSSRSSKIMSNMFRGVVASEVSGYENESSSNMTTPLAMPLPDSPPKHAENQYISLNEIIEPMAPLPPAVVNSHSTAAAASRALFEDEANTSDLPPESPEQPRQPKLPRGQHKRSTTDISVHSADAIQHSRSPLPQPIPKSGSSPLARKASPRQPLTQEDRRAAIRDYRAQARPLFTLEAPITSPRYTGNVRHDSSDSFPMFSASTDSSSKEPSLGLSFDSLGGPVRGRQDSEDWHAVQSDEFDSTPQSDGSGRVQQYGQGHYQDFENSKDSVDFAMDDTEDFGFQPERHLAPRGSSTKPKGSASTNLWDIQDLQEPISTEQPETVASSASEPLFHFEQPQTAPRTRIYSSNPIRRLASKKNAAISQSITDQDFAPQVDSASEDYVYSDFKPIDLTTYEPRLPFAWSALPLICHAIAFDMQEGIACSQFSVHLLMHLHPFFFNQAFRLPLSSPVPAPETLAERLMRPDLSHRFIGGLFAHHLTYLKRMNLFGPMAELRLMCVEFDYPTVYKPSQTNSAVGSALKQDPVLVQVSCSHCHSFIPAGTAQCQNCRKVRDACPVCLSKQSPATASDREPIHNQRVSGRLWTFCQRCGHGAHTHCMEEWLLQPNSEGECPTEGCGCDCGPGTLRRQRISRQATEASNNDMIRGSRSGSSVMLRDPLKVSPSPAVDKTRDALRKDADARDRGTQSGDEGSRRSMSSRMGSRSSVNLSTSGSRGGRESFGSRRVRLVTPGEEDEAPPSTS